LQRFASYSRIFRPRGRLSLRISFLPIFVRACSWPRVSGSIDLHDRAALCRFVDRARPQLDRSW
jgi:hypothetical protein